MPQMIFLNLPVRDLPRARNFYAALGFGFDERFCDDTAACVVISDAIFLMLLTHEKFAEFTDLPIADATKTAAHMLALSRDSRAEVDAITEAALRAGGGEPRKPSDMGFMYLRTFSDPDGHVWEPMWMDVAGATADGQDAQKTV